MRSRGARIVALVVGLALSATVTRSAPAPAKPARIAVNFSLYQELLNQHLWTVSEKGEPLETRFNYEKFYDEPGRAERTVRIRRQFLAAGREQLDPRSRTAWAINFYNFMVLEQITEHLLIPGKIRQRYLSVRDIHPEGGDFFKYPVVKIDTTNYSLDQFEHHFLFADFERTPANPRPPGLDPRIHFAIVCGAIGCPPLLPRAYRPDSLGLQLNRAVREALASPRHLKRVPALNVMQMSAIFFWYLPDFGGIKEALKWALDFMPKETRAEIERMNPPPALSQITWDWKLNQVEGWRFREQMAKPIPGD